jgi:hypothetical protein
MVYLQISLKVRADRRPAAAEIYTRYKTPFLANVAGARSKELLVRDDDVQVLHGFDSKANAEAYLKNPLFERERSARCAGIHCRVAFDDAHPARARASSTQGRLLQRRCAHVWSHAGSSFELDREARRGAG